MKTVFVDSGGIVAYLNTRDENHVKAKQALQELSRSKPVTFVTTDYVFVEVCNTFSGLGFRTRVHAYIESFINCSKRVYRCSANTMTRSGGLPIVAV